MRLSRRTQITDYHCGPAVIEMLLSNLGIEKTQEEITIAADAKNSIEENGVTVEQMAKAVEKLSPEVILYYKEYGSVSEIEVLLREYGLPVGVEWQGLFYDDEKEEEKGLDYGHYSVVTHVDYKRKALIIVDPFRDFANSDRIISIYKFMNRWYDTNEFKDPLNDDPIFMRDERLLFVISPLNPKMRGKLGLKSYY